MICTSIAEIPKNSMHFNWCLPFVFKIGISLCVSVWSFLHLFCLAVLKEGEIMALAYEFIGVCADLPIHTIVW